MKNYRRNSISQNRLTDLRVLNIERSRTEELDHEKIINDCPSAECRKKLFLSDYN